MNNLENSIYSVLKDLVTRRTGKEVLLNGKMRIFEDLGLDSFAFAELVLVLEQETKLDPFTQAGRVVPVRTVEDVVSVYADEARRKGI